MFSNKKAIRSLVAASSAVLAISFHAQPPPGPIDPNNMPPPANGGVHYPVRPNSDALLLYPELKTAPAPAWLKPGLRLTWHDMSASIPKSRLTFGGGPGGWTSLEESASASGQGFEEIDVLAVMPDGVAANIQGHHINPDRTTTPGAIVGDVMTPGDVLGAWLHPDVLKKYTQGNGDGVSNYPAEYKAIGQTYQAVWHEVKTSPESVVTDVWDTETGLLLHHAQVGGTALQVGVLPNNGGNVVAGGTTNLSQKTLVGMRELNTPWTKGHQPRGAANLHQLFFIGNATSYPTPNHQFTTREQITIKVIGAGDDFLVLQKMVVKEFGNQRSQPAGVELCSSAFSLTPLIADPDDLAQLKPGQVIDTDPVTKVVTSVARVGRDRQGHNAVVIAAAAPGGAEQPRQEFTYDLATGIRTGITTTEPRLKTVETVTLSRTE